MIYHEFWNIRESFLYGILNPVVPGILFMITYGNNVFINTAIQSEVHIVPHSHMDIVLSFHYSSAISPQEKTQGRRNSIPNSSGFEEKITAS